MLRASATSTGGTCGDAIVAASPRIGSPSGGWFGVASKAGRGVWVEALPAYDPDLNPVEWAWQHLKHMELRNVTCLDLEELQMQLHLSWPAKGDRNR
jgi:hypothetical protein